MQISHGLKILWQVYCHYCSIPAENYYQIDWWGKQIQLPRRSKEQWEFLHKSYYYCTQIDPVYEGSFEEFDNYLTKNNFGLKNPYKKKKYCRWAWWYNNPCKTGYCKKPEHQKKILSEKEQSRKDWREYKKLKKDKSKKHHRSYSRRQEFSKISNRQHRRWVKQRIYHQKWDLSDMEYKLFCNPRLWD